MGKSYVGDIGTRIRMTLNTSLAGASSVKFCIKKPNNSEVEKTCVVENVPTGIVYYDSETGDFNVAGEYYIQAKVTFTDGDIIKSTTARFMIYNAYE